MSDLPRYRIDNDYDWNFEHAPERPVPADVPECPGEWSLAGFRLNSPLGIPAGPLLNSKWILYYARLGFDVLTYKTVRSRARASYELPNLLPVHNDGLTKNHLVIPALETADPRSWAVSFGMPSKSPEHWQKDVRAAREGLAPGQVLSVSVVATPEPDWDIGRIADDYALCARLAADSGAHMVEINLSCPNVSSADGELFLDPENAVIVAERVRTSVGDAVPVIAKIGLFDERRDAEIFMARVAPLLEAISTVNCIRAQVKLGAEYAFAGQYRGIAGSAILDRSIRQVEVLREIAAECGWNGEIIGVGGAATAHDVQRYLRAGAVVVQMATAPMLDPLTGVNVRTGLALAHRRESRQ